MNLTEVRVQGWKNFVDSGWIPLEQVITCLVGKNESGKSAFLEALYRLKPAYAHNSKYDVDLHYPRWRKVDDQRSENLGEVNFVEARYSLTDIDRKAIAEAAGVGIPSSSSVEVGRSYDGALSFSVTFSEEDAVRNLLEDVGVLEPLEKGSLVPTLEGLIAYAKDSGRTDLRGVLAKAKKLQALVADDYSDELLQVLEDRLPTFFYFSDFARLRGHIDLSEVLSKEPSELRDHEQTAKSLLQLVGATGTEFSEGNIERRLAELEAAAAEITRQVFRYWRQNRNLRVSLVTEQEVIGEDTPQARIIHRFLDIRLLDQRHHVTTNFQTRSSGFRWFFSFIVAFNPFKGRRDVVVLLDEPGLSLHGTAQSDFLRFIEEQLAPSSQVIYTTHSPFLVDPSRLERVRVVEDLTSESDPDLGAVVSDEALSRDAETLFPLQAALGYELAQNLFIGAAEHLVVEGSTDFVYLDSLSEHLKSLGRIGLDKRFSIVPVGGAQNVPTFVALLGAHLGVSVLVDSSTTGMQRITNLVKRGLLDEARLITVAEIAGDDEADMEDLFEPEEYIPLFNAAFGSSISPENLDGKGPILKQVERIRGEKFDHGPPATEFLRNKVQVLEELSAETLNRFEKLFEQINSTLPT